MFACATSWFPLYYITSWFPLYYTKHSFLLPTSTNMDALAVYRPDNQVNAMVDQTMQQVTSYIADYVVVNGWDGLRGVTIMAETEEFDIYGRRFPFANEGLFLTSIEEWLRPIFRRMCEIDISVLLWFSDVPAVVVDSDSGLEDDS